MYTVGVLIFLYEYEPGKQKILLDHGWESNPRPPHFYIIDTVSILFLCCTCIRRQVTGRCLSVLFVFSTAKNLLEGMLEVDPAHRSTAMEIKDHPWVNVSLAFPFICVHFHLCSLSFAFTFICVHFHLRFHFHLRSLSFAFSFICVHFDLRSLFFTL